MNTPKSTVSVHMMNPKTTTLTELLQMMLEGRMSHCYFSVGTEQQPLFVHFALMADRVESSKLAAHLDRVTLAAIQRANELFGGSRGG